MDGEFTEWFETIVGVLQGCVLSPLLFNIFLEIVIVIALHGTGSGAVINGMLLSDLRFAVSTNRTEEDVTRRVGLARGNFQAMNNV